MDATSSLAEQMQPLLQRIGSSLIEATPEAWSEAVLRVIVQRGHGDVTSLSHTISSDMHPGEPCVPTSELFTATRGLQLQCEQVGKPWVALTVRIVQARDQWTFSSDFEYTS